MRPFLISPALSAVALFTSTASALISLPNSPCALQCGNVQGSTTGNDITCSDSGYGSLAGGVYQTCLNCQLGSTYVDPATNETDLQWALYNLRYAVSWCLWGYPNNNNVQDTPCLTAPACGPLQSGVETLATTSNDTAYSYCSGFPQVNSYKCTACLGALSDEFYLTNFVTTLEAGCQQKPAPGGLLSIQGGIFSTTPVNITAPSATPYSSYTPSTGLSLGAKVGIAVGAIVLVLFVTGFFIICCGRRRRRRQLAAHQRETGYAEWIEQQQKYPYVQAPAMASNSGFHDSPASARPLVSNQMWGAQPMEETQHYGPGGFAEKTNFSPYSSQYTSPVSQEKNATASRDWPADRRMGRSRSIDKTAMGLDGEVVEMQNVPPVVLQPTHGRGGYSGLTEDDARRGQAL